MPGWTGCHVAPPLHPLLDYLLFLPITTQSKSRFFALGILKEVKRLLESRHHHRKETKRVGLFLSECLLPRTGLRLDVS